MLSEREHSLPVGWSATHRGRFARESKDRAGEGHRMPTGSFCNKTSGYPKVRGVFRRPVHSRDTSKYKVVRPWPVRLCHNPPQRGECREARNSHAGRRESDVHRVRRQGERIDSDYLLAVLKSRHSLSVYESITQATVNRRGGISFRTLIEIWCLHHPPLSEQRKIAAILSSVDDAIEKTQAVIDQVQVVKRGLMQDLLTRGYAEAAHAIQEDGDW